CAVMFSVFTQSTQYRAQVPSKSITKRGSHARSAIGLCQHSGVTKFERFVQRYAEHVIGGFKFLNETIENLSFLLRKPCAPIVLNRGKLFSTKHEDPRRNPKYNKIHRAWRTFLIVLVTFN